MERTIKYRVLAWAVLLTASQAFADRVNDLLHERTYLGLTGLAVSVDQGGIFSGKDYSRYDNPYEIVLLPAIAQNLGFGALLGHREETYAMELSYWRSEHLATFGPVTLTTPEGPVAFPTALEEKAAFHSINVDFKKYFLTELEFQPFVNLGVSFPWLDLANVAADSDGNVTGATLVGLGLNLGVGVEYYLNKNLSFVGGIYERWTSFDQFKGHAGQFGPLSPAGGASHDGSGLQFLLGTTVGF